MKSVHNEKKGWAEALSDSQSTVLFFVLLFLVLTLYFYANDTSKSIFDSFSSVPVL